MFPRVWVVGFPIVGVIAACSSSSSPAAPVEVPPASDAGVEAAAAEPECFEEGTTMYDLLTKVADRLWTHEADIDTTGKTTPLPEITCENVDINRSYELLVFYRPNIPVTGTISPIPISLACQAKSEGRVRIVTGFAQFPTCPNKTSYDECAVKEWEIPSAPDTTRNGSAAVTFTERALAKDETPQGESKPIVARVDGEKLLIGNATGGWAVYREWGGPDQCAHGLTYAKP